MRALCAFIASLAAGFAFAAEPAADPFAYLEDAADPRTGDFLREEPAKARALLDAIPGRAELAARIRALSAAATVVTQVRLAGPRVFYLKLPPGSSSPALYVREGVAGNERLVADPLAQTIIEGFSPSPDGRHVVVGMAAAAGEEAVLHVIAVDAARALPGEIARVRSPSEIAWHPDGRSFFYARASEGAGRLVPVRVYRHVLGRDAGRDEIVFAPGVGGARDVPDGAHPALRIPADTRVAYAIVREGPRREIAVHATPLDDLAAARPRWQKVAGYEDEILAIEAWRDELYLLTKRNAPRNRVVRVKAGAGLAGAKQVVPQGDAVIQAMALAREALYLRTMVGGVDRLERVPLGLLGAKPPEYVRTPFDTAISQLLADPRQPGALLRLQGWIEPPAVVQVEAASGNLRRTPIQPPAAVDFSEMDEVRLYAPSHDGARIPVTLVYRKSTRLDGQNPTLVTAFGSFGAALAPTFEASRLAWLERGGIFAVAHVRGGGEYGDDWHRAGRGPAKINTVLDFIAVADYLVRYGFTNPRRLAIEGTGVGGIPVGGALARRPELFAAVIAREPVLDMLRFESLSPPALVATEFGGAAAGAQPLLAISAYHQVEPGGSYPAVLLIAPPRRASADVSQPAKMAARLAAASRSGKPVLLRLDDSADPRAARESELADIYAFLFWQMGEPRFQLPQPPPAPAELPAPPAPPAAEGAPAPTERATR